MRKRLIWTVAIGATLAVAAVAVAKTFPPTVIEAGNLVLKANGSVSPEALPKKTMVPISTSISGSIATKDGTHPPALRETVIDFDKNAAVNATGLPVCKQGQLTARSTKAAIAACPKAIVGEGRAEAEVAFPEQKPFKASGPLTLFNGGVKGGTIMLFLHFYASVPAPTAIITPVKITKIHAGRYGIQTVAKPEQVAGGAGSIIRFEFKVHRTFTYKGKKQSYLTAKCPDGHFNAQIKKAIFVNEASGTPTPAATLSGTVIRPCKPQG
jgi:hypothetical protein